MIADKDIEETISRLVRHLKGIVSALENIKQALKPKEAGSGKAS